MEDIFITVIIVASVIWSVVSKLREQKSSHTENPNPAPSVNWDEVLRELPHEPIEQPEVEVVEPEIQMEISPKIKEETPAPVIEQTPVEEEIENQDSDDELNISLSDADDLKRAVIYSEILNRKD